MEYISSVLECVDRGGGYMSFRLASPSGFSFQAGQYFILGLGDGLLKAFSFSSSPTEAGYFEFTTRMSGSEYKRRLSSLRPGDVVRFTGPMGDFTYRGQGSVVFLAGGIGITPFRSICKYLTDSAVECDVVLFWGVNTMEEAVFKGDFDAMSAVNPRLRVVYVPTRPPDGWVGCSGLICRDHLESEVPDLKSRIFYVCGPPKMVESMVRLLGDAGVGGGQVILERFGGY